MLQPCDWSDTGIHKIEIVLYNRAFRTDKTDFRECVNEQETNIARAVGGTSGKLKLGVGSR